MESAPCTIEMKTIGELIDQLIIENSKVWHLIDRVMGDEVSTDDARAVQIHNARRNELIRAINRRLDDRDIGGKVYSG